MPYRIVWSNRALNRVSELADFLAERRPPAAGKLVVRLFEGVEVLADHPRLAPAWSRLHDPNVRRLVLGDYLAYYEVADEDQTVIILTVRHGAERPPEPDEVL